MALNAILQMPVVTPLLDKSDATAESTVSLHTDKMAVEQSDLGTSGEELFSQAPSGDLCDTAKISVQTLEGNLEADVSAAGDANQSQLCNESCDLPNVLSNHPMDITCDQVSTGDSETALTVDCQNNDGNVGSDVPIVVNTNISDSEINMVTPPMSKDYLQSLGLIDSKEACSVSPKKTSDVHVPKRLRFRVGLVPLEMVKAREMSSKGRLKKAVKKLKKGSIAFRLRGHKQLLQPQSVNELKQSRGKSGIKLKKGPSAVEKIRKLRSGMVKKRGLVRNKSEISPIEPGCDKGDSEMKKSPNSGKRVLTRDRTGRFIKTEKKLSSFQKKSASEPRKSGQERRKLSDGALHEQEKSVVKKSSTKIPGKSTNKVKQTFRNQTTSSGKRIKSCGNAELSNENKLKSETSKTVVPNISSERSLRGHNASLTEVNRSQSCGNFEQSSDQRRSNSEGRKSRIDQEKSSKLMARKSSDGSDLKASEGKQSKSSENLCPSDKDNHKRSSSEGKSSNKVVARKSSDDTNSIASEVKRSQSSENLCPSDKDNHKRSSSKGKSSNQVVARKSSNGTNSNASEVKQSKFSENSGQSIENKPKRSSSEGKSSNKIMVRKSSGGSDSKASEVKRSKSSENSGQSVENNHGELSSEGKPSNRNMARKSSSGNDSKVSDGKQSILSEKLGQSDKDNHRRSSSEGRRPVGGQGKLVFRGKAIKNVKQKVKERKDDDKLEVDKSEEKVVDIEGKTESEQAIPSAKREGKKMKVKRKSRSMERIGGNESLVKPPNVSDLSQMEQTECGKRLSVSLERLSLNKYGPNLCVTHSSLGVKNLNEGEKNLNLKDKIQNLGDKNL